MSLKLKATRDSTGNQRMGAAKKAKQDEFYTQLVDIENELKHYKTQLRGKSILCNCDDPYESNFFKYFALNFNALGLKRLIVTSYKKSPIVGGQLSLFEIEGLKPEGEEPYAIEINNVPDQKRRGTTDITDVEYLLKHNANTAWTLKGDGAYNGGDFRSRECIELLKRADIVVTNPPFSLFRDFLFELVKHEKQFLIIGSLTAVHYKEIFKLIKDNKVWLGESIHSGDREFRVPDHYPLQAAGVRVDDGGNKYIRVKGVRWFTNIDIKKSIRHEKIPLYKRYLPAEFPTYDNLDAIEVSKASEIPCDYDGLIGVPDTFLDKYNPDQFEIIGIPFGNLGKEIGVKKNHRGRTDIAITKDGISRCPYSRIIIKRKGTA
ncbi:MAG: adenine-specific methyltransferase EcoRI family protein [Verrucomicrobiota bacterium]